MAHDWLSLSNPAYWLSGLVIFLAGVLVGRGMRRGGIPRGTWRSLMALVLILTGSIVLLETTHSPVPPTAAAPTATPVAAPLPTQQPPLARAPALMIPAPPLDAPARIVSAEIGPTNTKVGDTIDLKITVKNMSAEPLQSTWPEPGYTYVQGMTYANQYFASEPGKWRVAIGTGIAGADSSALPYRWGLGADLAPGAEATITGHIKLIEPFPVTNFWAALVHEPDTVVEAGRGMTLVVARAQQVAVVVVD